MLKVTSFYILTFMNYRYYCSKQVYIWMLHTSVHAHIFDELMFPFFSMTVYYVTALLNCMSHVTGGNELVTVSIHDIHWILKMLRSCSFALRKTQ